MVLELSETAVIAAIVTLIVGVVFVLLLQKSKKSDDRTDVSAGLRREEKATQPTPSADDKVLSAASFKQFRVLEVSMTSHNTKLIRFEIPFGKGLGLPIGRHVSVRAEVDGKPVMRAYTPTSRPDQKGYFDLLVKTYEFGKMSPHLHSLRVGGSLEVRGPVGRFKYTKNSFKNMGLIAGGTGLTPCLQVIRCVLEGPEGEGDTTTFTLLFQNRTEDDILLREELDKLAAKYSKRFSVIYFLSNPSDASYGNGSKANERRGYINADAMKTYLSTDACQFVGVCGPGGFTESMTKLLGEAGHSGEEKVHVF